MTTTIARVIRKIYLKLLNVMQFIMALMLLLLFQNCASHDSDPNSLGFGSKACDPYFQKAFNDTLYAYFQTNCVSCHIDGGQGKQSFAGDDRVAAWDQFKVISNAKAKVYNNSVSPSHAPGITGPQLEAGASETMAVMEEAENFCMQNTGVIGGIGVRTVGKIIDLDIGESKTLLWVLDSETSPTGIFSGALFFIDIEATSENYYTLSKPRLRTRDSAIYVRGISISINGVLIELATLFKGINETVPAYSVETTLEGILSEGAVIVSVPVNSNDRLEIGFEALSIQ